MPAPSPLAIATKAVERLVKEEVFYRAELTKQDERVRTLAAEIKAAAQPSDLDPNAEYVLGQETRAADETRAIFGPLKQRTEAALANLEEQISLRESRIVAGTGASDDDEIEKARAVLRMGQTAVAKP
ncbi:tubulin-specific chaperone [Niveomyces insectorum RCEF 264]|uniref:Tubulin-specific chaperone A n=1 Tax=Niveomyces insectorum RCEF 264 TaxID=1081102 RepID=A0A167TVG5_9HYPO|nr:tubulin-specific chaperone [Niveomyces insectorum RCEF 264]